MLQTCHMLGDEFGQQSWYSPQHCRSYTMLGGMLRVTLAKPSSLPADHHLIKSCARSGKISFVHRGCCICWQRCALLLLVLLLSPYVDACGYLRAQAAFTSLDTHLVVPQARYRTPERG